jgi:hypothetical protein
MLTTFSGTTGGQLRQVYCILIAIYCSQYTLAHMMAAFQTFTSLMAAAHVMYPSKSYPVALYSNAVTSWDDQRIYDSVAKVTWCCSMESSDFKCFFNNV